MEIPLDNKVCASIEIVVGDKVVVGKHMKDNRDMDNFLDEKVDQQFVEQPLQH